MSYLHVSFCCHSFVTYVICVTRAPSRTASPLHWLLPKCSLPLSTAAIQISLARQTASVKCLGRLKTLFNVVHVIGTGITWWQYSNQWRSRRHPARWLAWRRLILLARWQDHNLLASSSAFDQPVPIAISQPFAWRCR
jgi:hypothetical protein